MEARQSSSDPKELSSPVSISKYNSYKNTNLQQCSDDVQEPSSSTSTISLASTKTKGEHQRTDCPLSRSELGRNTWSFLHTMAAHFPVKPSADDSRDMSNFFRIFSRFYPCPTCAKDFSKLIEKEPPKTGSQTELKHWLCWAHNQVNKKLGKPKFDCSTLDERWKNGWKDGSCD